MKDRMDRIEDNLEQVTKDLAALTTENAVMSANVTNMTKIMEDHVKVDLKDHIIMKKQIKKNEGKLTYYAGCITVVVFIIGVFLKL